MNNAPASAGRGRGGKRQQQSLYSPGSGPLRKSENSGSNRSLNSIGDAPSSRDRDRDRERDRAGDWNQNDGGWRSVNKKSSNKKHDYYDQRRNDPSGFRQASEPRVLSTNPPNVSYNHRNPDRIRNERDSRSVEHGFGGRPGTSKKPPPLPLNFEILPPRLQRKLLQDHGLPLDYLEIMRNELPPPAGWSHTLPISPRSRQGMRGGGGGRRYAGNYQSGGGYQQQDYRARTPVDYQRPRSRSSDVGGDQEDFDRPPRTNSRNSSCDPNDRWNTYSCPPRDRDRSNDGVPGGFRKDAGRNRKFSDEGRLEEEEPRTITTGKLDWADDVEREAMQEKTASSINSTNNSNNNSNRNRRRHRSNSRSSTDYYDDASFKVPYPPKSISGEGGSSGRSRRNSQSSNISRENSMDRNAPPPPSYSGSDRRGRGGKHYSSNREKSQDRFYDHRGDRYGNRKGGDRYSNSRDNSKERSGPSSWPRSDSANWRGSSESHEKTDVKIAEMTKQFEEQLGMQKAPGVLVLPPKVPLVESTVAEERVGEEQYGANANSRALFDPKNPSKPIIVSQSQTRKYNPPANLDTLGASSSAASSNDRRRNSSGSALAPIFGGGRPPWYDTGSPQANSLRNKQMVHQLEVADNRLQELLQSGNFFGEWDIYTTIRTDLQTLLEKFLLTEMRFSQEVNVEHHFWKLLYYNIIELLRKLLAEDQDQNNRAYFREKALDIIESGTQFFEQLLMVLEKHYNFSLENFTGLNAATNTKGLKCGLALVSAQKIFLFLGDLARYREHVNEANNFRRAKQWYVKAQQILPKNGRPYNQLALLSVYAKRKIDAVYFYMRSLMSSNPFESARESLMDLFNETKKKYESSQRKREHRATRTKRKRRSKSSSTMRRRFTRITR